MSGNGAMGDEMYFRRLAEDDEFGAFVKALRSSLIQAPDPAASTLLIPRLAEAARAGAATLEAPRAASSSRRAVLAGRFARRRRRTVVARVAVAVASLPLVFAGLAFAGVNLPAPAQDAFEELGIELPNQTTDDDTEGTAKDGDSAGSATGQENSRGKLGHGKLKGNPARDNGHGKKGRGRALGKRGLAPGSSNSNGEAVGKSDSIPPGLAIEPPGKSSGGASGGGSANGGGRGRN
jgi:hypothetical protein